MGAPWTTLVQSDRAQFLAVVAFLERRLSQIQSIGWAAKLKSRDRLPRLAVQFLLDSREASDLVEPWATAWRLLEESWQSDREQEDESTSIYGVQARLKSGDRSGALVTAIVRLVEPFVEVSAAGSQVSFSAVPTGRVKNVRDLISARLTSPTLAPVSLLELEDIEERPFLEALARALEAAVARGIEIARRLGWDEVGSHWLLGGLERVCYVDKVGRDDPDVYHKGIAPSVKLLHEVVDRIAATPQAAQPFVRRSKTENTAVHLRLWAAYARDARLVSAEEVENYLTQSPAREFWNLHLFPEIAEMRARRFQHMSAAGQLAIAKRIRKGPPSSLWPSSTEASTLQDAKLYWTVREFQRIRVAGAQLPRSANVWVGEKIGLFPGLSEMDIAAGFREKVEASFLNPTPDNRYDAIDGRARLEALEKAFVSSRGGWDDDPAERARDWLTQNTNFVLADLASVSGGGAAFPNVWERIGWAHSPTGKGAPQRSTDATLVISLMRQLPDSTIEKAIDGLTNWLDSWRNDLVASPAGSEVWFKVWPIAVAATNVQPDTEREPDVDLHIDSGSEGREPSDLDTLNTPVGKMIGAFFAACPHIVSERVTFAEGGVAHAMREAVISAGGRSALIVRHRLVEKLPYFLNADAGWTERHLTGPLLRDDGASLALWRAVARETRGTNVLNIIGGAMAARATDRRLGRETRRSLAFSLVVESLQALRQARTPAVPHARIQQMLRTLDDETRASAAESLTMFVRDLAHPEKDGVPEVRGADLFRSAVAPFLNQVWPAERSLATRGVSAALADLPAYSGEAFTEAVDAIERFLIPFDCWSLFSYGFLGRGGGPSISLVNDEGKALALLKLLDLTVGTAEGSIIPNDLSTALAHIRVVAPRLEGNARFRRLSTAARR